MREIFMNESFCAIKLNLGGKNKESSPILLV